MGIAGMAGGLRRSPGWRPVGLATVALLVGAAERLRPLRRPTQREPRRLLRNLALGAAATATIATAEGPLVRAVASRAERTRTGLTQKLLPSGRVPDWVRDAAAVLLMDYATYGWHVLTHRVPVLWRFHLVHHVDMDLDSSTALRFHAADMLISAPVRALQVSVLGVSPRALVIWQNWFFAAVVFHHGNLRFPERWERMLNRFVTTPRMHGIHHSTVKGETDSNWSSGFSVWDRLHGTFRDDVAQEEIAIGVPGYRDAQEIGLPGSIRLPFGRQRDAWRAQPGTAVSTERDTGSERPGRPEPARMKPADRA
ncbi:MAG: sterol desaturase family protein [Gluconacetobacter diazotrophicus]|nr:sterol desaturase family protein [Gluconacetobacter diazotrophicus]